MEIDGVGFAGIGAPQENKISLLHLLIGGGSAPCSEHCRQTDDARSVSSSITGVNIVGSDGGSHEFLGRIVHLVCAL